MAYGQYTNDSGYNFGSSSDYLDKAGLTIGSVNGKYGSNITTGNSVFNSPQQYGNQDVTQKPSVFNGDSTVDTSWDNGLSGADKFNYGLKTIQIIGDLWGGYNAIKIGKEQNKLARETFEFNKDLSTKNYNLAKADHDRQVERSRRITEQYSNADKTFTEGVKRGEELRIERENEKRNRIKESK